MLQLQSEPDVLQVAVSELPPSPAWVKSVPSWVHVVPIRQLVGMLRVSVAVVIAWLEYVMSALNVMVPLALSAPSCTEGLHALLPASAGWDTVTHTLEIDHVPTRLPPHGDTCAE